MSRLYYDGQPVICVDARFRTRWWRAACAAYGITLPTLGTRYVVRGYVDAPGPPCLLLREIANPLVEYSDRVMREAAFADFRFRPATDIGDLTKLLRRRTVWKPLERDTPQWDKKRERKKEDA